MKSRFAGRPIRLLTRVMMAFVGSLVVAGRVWAGGDLFWEDQFDKAGGDDTAQAITANGTQVFVAGLDRPAVSGPSDFLVRAYDALTGDLLWEDQVDKGGLDEALAITANGPRVFAAGKGGGVGSTTSFLVRAYDARTGKLLWEDQLNRPMLGNRVESITTQGPRVFAAGLVQDADGTSHFLVRAYDARTGKLLWEDQVDEDAIGSIALAISGQGDQVFAAGSVAPPFAREHFLRTGLRCPVNE